MASQGSIIARVYTSDAYLPLPNAAVIFTKQNSDGTQTLLALRRTDSSGLTEPLFLGTPDPAESLSPNSALLPYSTVDVRVYYPGYNSVNALGVQIFPGVETIQGLQLHPTTADEQGDTITYPESNQNL